MSDQNETHPLSLTDIPHVIRMAGAGVMLDSRLSRTESTAHGALLSSLLPHTSRHTIVARHGQQRAVSQFVVSDTTDRAHLVYLAPTLAPRADNSAWLFVLEATTREAGRRGAHTISAELDEESQLFITMRQAGYAVYARQQLWTRPADSGPLPDTPTLQVVPTNEGDRAQVQWLIGRTVPSLLQQVGQMPTPEGYLYYNEGEVMAFVHVTEGRDGFYLMPFIDHHVESLGGALIGAVMAQLPRVSRKRVTVRVRRYQGWLAPALEALGMVCDAKQAVMVRHIAAGVYAPSFSALDKQKVSAGQMPRSIERIPEAYYDVAKIQAMSNTHWTSYLNRVRCDGMSRNVSERCALRPDNGGVVSPE